VAVGRKSKAAQSQTARFIHSGWVIVLRHVDYVLECPASSQVLLYSVTWRRGRVKSTFEPLEGIMPRRDQGHLKFSAQDIKIRNWLSDPNTDEAAEDQYIREKALLIQAGWDEQEARSRARWALDMQATFPQWTDWTGMCYRQIVQRERSSRRSRSG